METGNRGHSVQEGVIVSAADEFFFPGLLVALASIAYTTSKQRTLHFVVMDGGIADSSFTRLRGKLSAIRPDCRVERVDVRMLVDRYQSASARIGHMAFARFWIPDKINAGRALYVDADTFALDDVTPLLNLDLNGALVAAVKDPGISRLRKDWPWPDPFDQPRCARYFNSGMLLIDLDGWRAEGIGTRCIQLLEKYHDICFWQDQTVLNYVLRGRVAYLPDQWNLATRHYYFGHHRPPRLLHFMWPVKPWKGSAESDAYAIWSAFANSVAGIDCSSIKPSLRTRLKFLTQDAYPPMRAGLERLKLLLNRGNASEARHWKLRAIQAQIRRRHRAAFRRWLTGQRQRWRATITR